MKGKVRQNPHFLPNFGRNSKQNFKILGGSSNPKSKMRISGHERGLSHKH